jgi:hypothetical protein
MSYGTEELTRPIPLVWERKQRGERWRFSLSALLAALSLSLLIVEALDSDTVVSYASTLWSVLPHWPLAPPAH